MAKHNKNNKVRKTKDNREKTTSGSVAMLKSLGYGITACAVTVCLVSLLLNSMPDPDIMLSPLCLLCAAVSGLVGGITYKKTMGKVSPVSTCLVGLAFTAIMFFTSLVFEKDSVNSGTAFKVVCALFPPVFSFLGGKMTGNAKKSRKV